MFAVERRASSPVQNDLVRHSVIAGLAARHAIVEPVFTQTNIGQALAATAILLASTLFLGRVALQAEVLLLSSSSGAHVQTLALELWPAKIS